jgi:hypothetical protein
MPAKLDRKKLQRGGRRILIGRRAGHDTFRGGASEGNWRGCGVNQQLLSARVDTIFERIRLGEATLSRVQVKQPLIAEWRN